MILYIFTTDGLHTEKGAEFTLETKFKNRERCYKILSTLSDNLHKLLLSEKDEDIVKSAYSGLISMKNSYYHMMMAVSK